MITSSVARDQADALSQVTDAISEIDHATQQNAALVEQASAAADSLRQQSQRSAVAVARFTLRDATVA